MQFRITIPVDQKYLGDVLAMVASTPGLEFDHVEISHVPQVTPPKRAAATSAPEKPPAAREPRAKRGTTGKNIARSVRDAMVENVIYHTGDVHRLVARRRPDVTLAQVRKTLQNLRARQVVVSPATNQWRLSPPAPAPTLEG